MLQVTADAARRCGLKAGTPVVAGRALFTVFGATPGALVDFVVGTKEGPGQVKVKKQTPVGVNIVDPKVVAQAIADGDGTIEPHDRRIGEPQQAILMFLVGSDDFLKGRRLGAGRTRLRRRRTGSRALRTPVASRSPLLPPEQRVLVTAHDAFAYFGRAYGFEVRGLLGVSTAAEAGAADVQRLAEFIVARRVPAVFLETSVAPRFVGALREAVAARGFAVVIGGSLYSDSLGDPGSDAGTYAGTVRANVETIVGARLNLTTCAR